jgi:transposase, IS6 family
VEVSLARGRFDGTKDRFHVEREKIRRRVNPGLGVFSFQTGRRTIGGYEVMNMIRKGQVKGIGKGNIQGQVRFVTYLFEAAA